MWPWGAYLGDEGVASGVRMKVSSWQRHSPNAMPPAAKGTGMYINSQMAKVEALKAGTTGLAEMAATLGYTDQAHFTHDFRTMTGMTPGEFLRDQPVARPPG